MSVRRKGPRATIVRVFTYLSLVSVAVVVIFPFVVAFATSQKPPTWSCSVEPLFLKNPKPLTPPSCCSPMTSM